MKKKISLILVAMMCILMVGCKNKDNDIPTNTKTPAKVEKVVEKPVVNKQESAKETSTEMLETILENIQSSNETFSWNKTLKIKDNDNKIQYIEVSINENDTEACYINGFIYLPYEYLFSISVNNFINIWISLSFK